MREGGARGRAGEGKENEGKARDLNLPLVPKLRLGNRSVTLREKPGI
jgi:hypothetical protein